MDQKEKLAEAKRALLAKRLKGKKNKTEQPADNIPKLAHSEPTPLSFAQQRFFFTHQIDQSPSSHNVYSAWKLDGPVDHDQLNAAFQQLVKRQSILATKIEILDQVPMQAYFDPDTFVVNVIDLSNEPSDQISAQADRLIAQEFNRPFDLQNDRLIRLTLLQLNREKTSHTLLLNIHHIISDEYSSGLIWGDLAAFYNDAQPTLDPLPIDFRDFADWQTSWLENNGGDQQLNYWRDELGGEVNTLQLPLDYPRPVPASGKGNLLSKSLDVSVSEQISALSKQTGATPFMIWMALFHTLLYRYTDQESVWVGTPVGNRQRPEVKKLVGLFLNTIVVRSNIGPNMTFIDLLTQIQTKSVKGLANQDVPFDQVVNDLQPDRSTGLTPLFQSMLVYAAGSQPPQFNGITFERIEYKSEFAKLDLTLFVKGGPVPTLSIQYSTDIFAAETIGRMLDHLQTLVTDVLANPAQTLHQFELLTSPEKEQILVDWNAPKPAPNTAGKLLHSLILAHAKTKFNHAAVIGGAQTLTYRELDLQSGNLARHLQSLGVNGSTNPKIGVMVDRRPEMLVGILAILRAGGAYVPIDPDYPAERIEHIVTDSQLDIVLTTGDYSLPATINRPITLINLTQPLPEQPTAELGQIAPPTPDALAYVIYTSGSTGKPKGVMVTHANIVHSTTARYAFYENPAERFLLLSSFAFDSSMVGIFWTLCQGGTLILPEQGMHQNVGWLNKTIETEAVTHLLALPSLYQILLDESAPDQLRSLNTVMVAGEACHAGLVAQHYRKYPQSSLYNEYGPTEGTVWSHAYRFPQEFVGPTVPIGQNIPNVTHYILDSQQQPVPIGIAGELVIGGAGITRGYLNRDDLTAEKFVTLPHLAASPEDRFYRTGDLVKWGNDGNVIFLGRVDHQVKIRGFRVELGEIEATLINQPQISAAAVKAVQEPNGPTKRLVAWFTSENKIDLTQLRAGMGKTLPDYMVPAEFVQLAQMPLTPNGKVNRNALVPPPPAQKGGNKAAANPTTQTEKTLLSIWKEVLKAGSMGVDDNFFELGGHSLLAIQLFSKIEKEFGAVLPLATIFQLPTVAALARKLDQEQETLSLQEQLLVPLRPDGDKEPIFLIHDGAGYVYQYERLVPHIAKNRPMYGIIPPDWDGRRKVMWNLEEMVEHYTAIIKSIQPSGPYHLSGFSLGGILAFEIACRLQQDGEKIGLLGLVEPTAWDASYRFKGDPNKSGMARHLDNLGRLNFKQKMIYIRESMYGRGNNIYQAIVAPYFAAQLDKYPDRVPRHMRDGYYISNISLELLESYTPSKFDGDLQLFMMDRGPLVEGGLGWETHNNGETTLNILNTRNHSKLIEAPFIGQIGKLITEQIDSD